MVNFCLIGPTIYHLSWLSGLKLFSLQHPKPIQQVWYLCRYRQLCEHQLKGNCLDSHIDVLNIHSANLPSLHINETRQIHTFHSFPAFISAQQVLFVDYIVIEILCDDLQWLFYGGMKVVILQRHFLFLQQGKHLHVFQHHLSRKKLITHQSKNILLSCITWTSTYTTHMPTQPFVKLREQFSMIQI